MRGEPRPAALNPTLGPLCERCNRPLRPLKDFAEAFFINGAVECDHCKGMVDPWSSMLSLGDHDGAVLFTLPALGANLSIFTFQLRVHEWKDLDFANCGVSSEAIILSVGYTPNGRGCFPMEFRGNDARRRFAGTGVKLYGAPFPPERPEACPDEGIPIVCAVCWIYQDNDSEPWLFLADAFEAVADWRLARMTVPGHAAFEVSLSRLIRDYLSGVVASKDKLNDFMVNSLTASGALNVLLPLLCLQAHVPMLAPDIVSALNALRTLRNKVVHEALLDEEVEKKAATRGLAGAVFGFEFVRFLRAKLGQ